MAGLEIVRATARPSAGRLAGGHVYALGGAKLEVAQPRIPCWKISRRWGMPDLTQRVERNLLSRAGRRA